MQMETTQRNRRRSTRTIDLGRLDGGRLKLRTFIRLSAADCSTPPDTLYFADRSIRLNAGDLPASLSNLIPREYLTRAANAADWRPFIRLATARGFMK